MQGARSRLRWEGLVAPATATSPATLSPMPLELRPGQRQAPARRVVRGLRSLALAVAALLASGPLGCAATTPPYAASNATKMTEAAAFAGAAAVAQVVESAMEARARNNAPTSHSASGLRVTRQCDNEGLYPCLSVEPVPGAAPPPAADPEMSDEEARAYVLDFINSVRRLNAIAPLVRDPSVDGFAQDGSQQLARDHRPNQHMTDHAVELGGDHAEVQASPEASSAQPLQERLGAILVQWVEEKADGPHRATLMRPDFRKVGVGIVTRDGHTYFTVDLSS